MPPGLTGLLAHGIGTRADLPLPVGYVVVGGGLAVAVSFLALGRFWRSPRGAHPQAGRPLPAVVTMLVDGPGRSVARGAVLALTLLVIVVAFAGPADVGRNAAPWAFFVSFWVGLVPVSLLLGPVWGVLNPLRTVYRLLRPHLPAPRRPELVDRLGYWPAATALAVFTWYELAAPDRADPRRVGVVLVGYAAVQLTAAAACGERWFARGDGFEVWSRLLGGLAPLSRRDDGRLVVRAPLRGAAAMAPAPGLAATLLVLVGSTAFDGLSRTRWWQQGPGVGGDTAVLPATVGLAGALAVVAGGYLAAQRLGRWLDGPPDGAALFAPSLIPVAAGYTVAHYFSLLLFDGQTTWILLSDPLGTGADLLGLTGRGVDYTLVSARTIALVQAGAIVAGHVAGVALAHDRALRSGAATRAQLPMLAIMVLFTTAGLGLLLGG